MILFLGGFLLGGLAGVVLMAMVVAAGDADKRPRIGGGRTVNRPGTGCTIAVFGSHTVDQR